MPFFASFFLLFHYLIPIHHHLRTTHLLHSACPHHHPSQVIDHHHFSEAERGVVNDRATTPRTDPGQAEWLWKAKLARLSCRRRDAKAGVHRDNIYDRFSPRSGKLRDLPEGG
jgi:hypothetical protein